MPKFEDKHMERLFYSASTDETRMHLNSVHMEPKLGKAVATDGHRLYACEKWFSNKWKGTTFKVKPLMDLDYVALEANYPKVEQIVPKDRWDYAVTFKVPTWLHKFKKWSKKSDEVLICLDATSGTLSVGRETKKETDVIYFNGNMLAPFAGETVKLFFRSTIEPILIVPEGGSSKANDNEWFYVVMPMRPSDGNFLIDEIEVLKTVPKTEQPKEKEVKEEKSAEVLSIVPAINKKSRTTCNECNHVVQSEDDWGVGCDLPPSSRFPKGTQDSGIFVCPECDALQDHTVFDGMVHFNPESGDFNSAVPGFLIDDLCNAEYEEGSFNLGNALINAARLDVLERYGKKAVDVMFPGEREYLLQKIKEMNL